MFKGIKIIAIWFIFLSVFFLARPAWALSIVVHVPEKYTDVEVGERFYFELDIKYPENPSRKDLRLNYEIIEGENIIAQAQLLKAVETQASFMDYIVIPESAEEGLHTINVKVADYEDLDEEASATFHVIGDKNQELKLYFFVLLGVIVLVGFLVIISIFVNKKRA